jgi:hypothetical protein
MGHTDTGCTRFLWAALMMRTAPALESAAPDRVRKPSSPGPEQEQLVDQSEPENRDAEDSGPLGAGGVFGMATSRSLPQNPQELWEGQVATAVASWEASPGPDQTPGLHITLSLECTYASQSFSSCN